ncbi:putative G-protein coupled receptor moody [Hypsibius exemplaris]|uniref:G-protein coupled receptor moody n=1 Tax=Hypsibius exemplaris TaxID=2072580 RepID=A0A9X6RLL7_HYPEX|nr:putative G-protein coupled receptor moody [Hypsibius exemplaris]
MITFRNPLHPYVHELTDFATANSTNETLVVVPIAPELFLETHVGWMIVTALVIGTAALIGTLGNVLALRTCGNVLSSTLLGGHGGAVAGRRVLMENADLCEWIASFCAPACMSSMWNMCAISMNRYVLICKPHLYPRIYTFKSSILCCVGIWLLAHLLCMPNHVGWGRHRFSYEYYICTFDIVTHTYGIFYIMTGVIIPLVGVLFGYTAIFMKVHSVKKQIRNHQQSLLVGNKRVSIPTTPGGAVVVAGTATEEGAPNGVADTATEKPKKRPQKPGFTVDDVKLAKTLFAAFLIFLICWLPFAIFVVSHDPDEIPRWLYVIAIIMAHGNSAVNPILYGLTNERFRDGYRTILGLDRRAVGDKNIAAKRSMTYGHGLLPDTNSAGASIRTHSRRESAV